MQFLLTSGQRGQVKSWCGFWFRVAFWFWLGFWFALRLGVRLRFVLWIWVGFWFALGLGIRFGFTLGYGRSGFERWFLIYSLWLYLRWLYTRCWFVNNNRDRLGVRCLNGRCQLKPGELGQWRDFCGRRHSPRIFSHRFR